MTREDIVTQVNSLLAEEFEVAEETFAPEDNIKETLSLDSLSLVDLVALVQQTYKVTIPLQELRQIVSFNDLYDYILTHLPGND
ncbi:MAG: acyl carrier protein [Prevotella sp.]